MTVVVSRELRDHTAEVLRQVSNDIRVTITAIEDAGGPVVVRV